MTVFDAVRNNLTWVMANSQIMTSKNPKNGARYLNPFETNIRRKVPMLWSRILARNINMGSTTQAHQKES